MGVAKGREERRSEFIRGPRQVQLMSALQSTSPIPAPCAQPLSVHPKSDPGMWLWILQWRKNKGPQSTKGSNASPATAQDPPNCLTRSALAQPNPDTPSPDTPRPPLGPRNAPIHPVTAWESFPTAWLASNATAKTRQGRDDLDTVQSEANWSLCGKSGGMEIQSEAPWGREETISSGRPLSVTLCSQGSWSGWKKKRWEGRKKGCK